MNQPSVRGHRRALAAKIRCCLAVISSMSVFDSRQRALVATQHADSRARRIDQHPLCARTDDTLGDKMQQSVSSRQRVSTLVRPPGAPVA